MAVQVSVETLRDSRPRLYVIDCTRPEALRRPPLHPLDAARRRRRVIKKLRQAGEAFCWAAGSAALVMVVLGGLAGLR